MLEIELFFNFDSEKVDWLMIVNVIVSLLLIFGIFFLVLKIWKNLVNIVYVFFSKVKVILKKKKIMRKYNYSENIRLYSNI